MVNLDGKEEKKKRKSVDGNSKKTKKTEKSPSKSLSPTILEDSDDAFEDFEELIDNSKKRKT